MKKCTALLLVLIVFLLASCGAADSGEPATESTPQTTGAAELKAAEDQPPFFELESLPEIGAFSTNGTQKRWYNTVQNTLKPREDYGQLIPFIGDVYRFSDTSDVNDPYDLKTLNYRYGLMTEDGTIVVDAVFPYLEYYDVGACGVYVVEAFSTDDVRYSAGEALNTGGYVIAGDGAWSIRVPDGKEAFVEDSVIVIGASPEDGFTWADDHEIYDLQGRHLFTLQNDDVDFDNELVFVKEYKGVIVRKVEDYSDGTNEGYALSFYDRTGKRIEPDWADAVTEELLYPSREMPWQPEEDPSETDRSYYLESASKPYAAYSRYSNTSESYLYSLLDARTNEFVFSDYDLIRVFAIHDKTWILTVRNNVCRVLDGELHTLYQTIANA